MSKVSIEFDDLTFYKQEEIEDMIRSEVLEEMEKEIDNGQFIFINDDDMEYEKEKEIDKRVKDRIDNIGIWLEI